MKLINNQPSPFGRKVIIALKEKGIPFEIEWDIPWHKDTKVNHYNPLEQLPILVTEDNQVLYESSYILEWLEHHYPDPALVPSQAEDLLEMKLFQVLGVGVMDAIVRINFELARAPECQSNEWLERQKRKIKGGLKEVNRRLGNNEFAVAGMLTHADLEIGSVLGHLDFLAASIPALSDLFEKEIAWRKQFSNLGPYIDNLEKRQSFRECPPQMVEIDFQSVVS